MFHDFVGEIDNFWMKAYTFGWKFCVIIHVWLPNSNRVANAHSWKLEIKITEQVVLSSSEESVVVVISSL